MDSKTHIKFASHMLNLLGIEPSLAVMSLLPTLDRIPLYQHRLMLHSFSAIPVLIGEMRDGNGAPPRNRVNSCSHTKNSGSHRQNGELYQQYVRTKLLEGLYESQWNVALAEYVAQAKVITTEQSMAITLAYGTHLFLDTWNNPIQCFVPWDASCTFQWSLLPSEKYFSGRLTLYSKPALRHFRDRLVQKHSWPSDCPGKAALILGLLDYIASMSRPKPSENVIASCTEELEAANGSLIKKCSSQERDRGYVFWSSVADMVTRCLRITIEGTNEKL